MGVRRGRNERVTGGSGGRKGQEGVSEDGSGQQKMWQEKMECGRWKEMVKGRGRWKE